MFPPSPIDKLIDALIQFLGGVPVPDDPTFALALLESVVTLV